MISKIIKFDVKKIDGCFPDSTFRGNAELGDNNQIQVALVIYLCSQGKIGGNLGVGLCVNNVRLRVQYISLGVQITDYRLDTDQD